MAHESLYLLKVSLAAFATHRSQLHVYVCTKGLLGCPATNGATLILQAKYFTYVGVPTAATTCGMMNTKSAPSADLLHGLKFKAAYSSFPKP